MNRPVTVYLIIALLVLSDLAGYITITTAGVSATVGFTLLSALMIPFYYWMYSGQKWTWILAIFVTLANTVGILFLSSNMDALGRTQSLIEIATGLVGFVLLMLPPVRNYFNSDRSDEEISFDLGLFASPSKRFFAFLIDVLIASIFGVALLFVASFVAELFGTNIAMLGKAVEKLVAVSSFAIAFLTLPILTSFGGTVGQRIFKFKVVDRKGESISLVLSVIRFLYVIFFGIVSIFVLFFDKYLRTIPDNMTRTFMVSK